MNLHRLACRFGQHAWVSDENYDVWDIHPTTFTDAICLICEKPHPENVDMQCRLGGHVWSSWGPIVPVAPKAGTLTQKASATLGAELLAQMAKRNEDMLGKTIIDKEPTQCRRCTRCKLAYEDDGERHFEGGWLAPLINEPMVGSLVWAEDEIVERDA